MGWRNYGENQRVRPASIKIPSTLDELRSAIRLGRARSVGSGHSYSGIVQCDRDAHLLELGGSRGRLKARCRVPQAMCGEPGVPHVAFETSVTIREACEWLDQRGLAFSTLGAVNVQTVVGAMATGTHGADLRAGPLSNAARGFLVFDHKGRLRWIVPADSRLRLDPQALDTEASWLAEALRRAEEHRDDRLFRAAQMGLGAVGVIYAVVLAVEPQYVLRETKRITRWEDVRPLIGVPEDWSREQAQWSKAPADASGKEAARQQWNRHQQRAFDAATPKLVAKGETLGGAAEGETPLRTMALTINPYATEQDGVRGHTCVVTRTRVLDTAPEVDCQADPARTAQFMKAWRDKGWFVRARRGIGACLLRWVKRLGLERFLAKFISFVLQLVPRHAEELIDSVIRAEPHQRTGRSHHILTRDVYEVQGWGIEVGVAFDQLPAAIDDLLEYAEELRKKGQVLTGPISVRPVTATDAWLGPSYDGLRVMIELTMVAYTPLGEQTLVDIERRLIDRHDGRFHWGLEWDEIRAKDVRDRYPGVADFRSALGVLDPVASFASARARQLGIVPDPAP